MDLDKSRRLAWILTSPIWLPLAILVCVIGILVVWFINGYVDRK